MTSLQERYKKAYAELLAAREENEKMSKQFYAIKGKTNEANQAEALQKWVDSGKRLVKAAQNERVLADKIPEQLKREIQKMPLPLDVRNEIRGYVGIGRRKTRKTKKTRKTRRRRV
jgi:hypothetical protein